MGCEQGAAITDALTLLFQSFVEIPDDEANQWRVNENGRRHHDFRPQRGWESEVRRKNGERAKLECSISQSLEQQSRSE